jgi:ornithine carbamoyltransferase
MSKNLHNRSFLALRDFTPDEIDFLLHLAADLKAAKYAGTEVQHLVGREIVLIFEKDSTRTRVGFEVAAYDQGAHVTYLGPSGSHIGKKETVKDTARVLGRVYDAIEYRGYGQKIVEELAQWSGVPVYNGLTNEFHPTQVLADLLTMREHSNRPLNELAFCFLGDTGNNMGDSLMIGGCKMGMDVRLCGPKSLWPDPALVTEARRIAEQTGAKLTLTDDVAIGVREADFLYTDVWVSMGEHDDVWATRIAELLPYQVNAAMMQKTVWPDTKFMHCLPAFHNTDTEVGARIAASHGLDALEVTDEVFESHASIVFDQAENRMHTIKAVLVATLGH